MVPEDQDLDDVQNKAMHPVFQTTSQTPETQAIVLDLENAQEKSRKAWDGINKHFQGKMVSKSTNPSSAPSNGLCHWDVWTLLQPL